MEAEDDSETRAYEALLKERQKVEVLAQTVKILEREKEGLKAQLQMELKEEQQKVVSLEQSLKASISCSKDLPEEVLGQIEDLEGMKEEALEQVHQVKNRNRELEEEVERLNLRVSGLETALSQVNSQVVTSTQLSSLQDKETALLQAQADCEELAAENGLLQGEVLNVNQLLVDLRSRGPEERLSRVDQWLSTRKRPSEEGNVGPDSVILELEKLRIEFQSLDEEFAVFRKKSDTEKQTILQLCKSECDDLTRQVEAKEAENESFREEVDSLRKQLERTKEKQSEMLEDYQVMEDEVHNLENTRKRLATELCTRNQKITALEQELSSDIPAEAKSAAELRTKLAHLQMKNKDTEALMATIRLEKKEELAASISQVADLSAELKAEKKRNQALIRGSDKLKREVEALTGQIKEMEEFAIKAKSKLQEELMQRILSVEQEKLELKRALEDLQDELEVSRKSIFYGQPTFLDELKQLDRQSIRPSFRNSRISCLGKAGNETLVEALRVQIVVSI